MPNHDTASAGADTAVRESVARTLIIRKFGPDAIMLFTGLPPEATPEQCEKLNARVKEARQDADALLSPTGPLASLLAGRGTVADGEVAEVVALLRNAVIDYDGSQEVDGAEPVRIPTCGTLRRTADLLTRQASELEEARRALEWIEDKARKQPTIRACRKIADHARSALRRTASVYAGTGEESS